MTKTSPVWILFFKSIFFPLLIIYLALYYKPIGFEHGIDDLFMTSVISYSRVTRIMSNFFWGLLVDKYSAKSLLLSMIIPLIFLSFSLPWAFQRKITFAIWYNAIEFLVGGNFIIILTA